jgi:hypothetical protein
MLSSTLVIKYQASLQEAGSLAVMCEIIRDYSPLVDVLKIKKLTDPEKIPTLFAYLQRLHG